MDNTANKVPGVSKARPLHEVIAERNARWEREQDRLQSDRSDAQYPSNTAR